MARSLLTLALSSAYRGREGIHKRVSAVQLFGLAGFVVASCWTVSNAQTVTIDTSPAGQRHEIDGFGTCLSAQDALQDWWKDLYFNDLGASILRFDITPQFNPPYSDNSFNSLNWGNAGPDGNFVRTYTNRESYSRSFNGHKALIPPIQGSIENIVRFFNYTNGGANSAGLTAKQGFAHGEFKLIGSMWSPAPWLKVSDGHRYGGGGNGMPAKDTPFPFLWLGNFAGGRLDTSPSALQEFGLCTASYLYGFQKQFGVKLYAISIQNELNFDEFYHSCTYPRASQYVAAVNAVHKELFRNADLSNIKIMGPEDVLGGDPYSMWQYGGGNDATAKNLQFVQAVENDPAAAAAVSFFCIHGYASDGVQAANATPTSWNWWVNGWQKSPAPGIPDNVHGIAHFNKKSWVTETSGENPEWIFPKTGFPSGGAWSIALRIHQALTVGQEHAWLYWQVTDGKPVAAETLTDKTLLQNSPKYVAAKHFFRYIRPGAMQVDANVSGADSLLASAYWHKGNGTLTVVLINTSPKPIEATLASPAEPANIHSWETYTSSEGKYWQKNTAKPANKTTQITVPGYGVVTAVAKSPM